MFNRAFEASYDGPGTKHRQRYVNEIAGRHGIHDADTIDQTETFVARLVWKRFIWHDLAA